MKMVFQVFPAFSSPSIIQVLTERQTSQYILNFKVRVEKTMYVVGKGLLICNKKSILSVLAPFIDPGLQI